MGYRSDIKVAIKKANTAAVEKFDEVNAKHHYFTRSETVSLGDEIVVYSGEWLKWYEGDFPDVDEYMSVVNDDDFSADIDYIRIGEDINDIEQQGCNDWLTVSVTAAVNP